MPPPGWDRVKAVLVPSSFIGGLRGSKRPAILLDVYHACPYEGLREAEQMSACG